MIVLRILAFLLAFGCSSAETATEPVWGKQPCVHCHMLLSEPRHAAQVLTRSGEHLHFDDVGCMLEYLSTESHAVSRLWARDASGSWIDALHARYQSGQNTPMGYGIVVSPAGELDFTHAQQLVAQRKLAGGRP